MEIPSSGDQYNLKWNNHLANFVQTFIEHQNGESLVDVTLSCEGQYIKAHKLILSACSVYFHSIFQVHGTLQHPIILLNGVRFVDLKYILHFMYHGEVKVVDKDLPNVLALGETLQIKGLSSVKLRDMPQESAPPATIHSSKKLKHILPYIEPKVNPPQLPVIPLPSEIPYYMQSSNGKAAVENRRIKASDMTKQNQANKKEYSFMSVEEPSPKKLSQSPPISSTTKTTPLPNNTDITKEVKSTIPKPPHAFMIFTNEWRKKLTIEHLEENNKEISVRLGNMWKNLLPETKNIYYKAAKRAEEEHMAQYPDYVGSNETLKRKADVLNEDNSKNESASTSIDPLDIVEIQEHVSVSDGEP